jgi:hypothetical protein
MNDGIKELQAQIEKIKKTNKESNMTNQILACLTITATFLAILGGIVQPYYYYVGEILFTIAGLSWLIFGTWLAIRNLD